MFRAWRSRPFRFRTLLHALQNWRPLLTQAERSGYVFALNLPYFLTDILGKFGNFWMYRLMNAIACNSPKKPLQGPEGWDMMASSLGPSQAEAGSSGPSASSAVNQNVGENGIREAPFAYPPSVALRAALGGWRSKIGVYRHGLAFSPWTKSLDVLVRLDELQYEVRSPSVESPVGAERGGLAHQLSGSRVGGVLDLGPAGSFGAPTTVLWGKRDIAVEMGLATDGMADYFGVAGSQFVVVEKATHWTPLDPTAIPVWKAVLLWATTGEHGRLEEVVGNMDGVKIVAES
jgi:pimeloyl-ACP methyl ester carboxylesterase